MNNADVIKSYLVSLGFTVDQPELNKFDAALKHATDTVSNSTGDIGKAMFGWQTAIVGAFSAVGLGVISLLDKTSQAQMGFENFALSMFMPLNQAKALKTALDAVGVSMEQATWNPEAHKQVMDLYNLSNKLQEEIGGPDWKEKAQELQDFREEMLKLQVEVQYISEGLAYDLFKAIDGEALVARLQKVVDWVENHGPEITKWVADNVAPVFKDWEKIVEDLAGTFEQIGVAFTNLVGLLSGDTAIEGTTFSFDNLGKAIQHTIHWFDDFVGWITTAERMLLHFSSSAELALSGIGAAMSGHTQEAQRLFADARKEFSAGIGDITIGSTGVLAGAGLGAWQGAEAGAAIGSIVPGVGTAIGGALGAAGGALAGGIGSTVIDKVTGAPADSGEHGYSVPQEYQPQAKLDPSALADRAYHLALKVGADLHVDPKLIFEQWAHETGGFRSRLAREQNNFGGMKLYGMDTYASYASPEEYAQKWEENFRRNYLSSGVQNAQTEQQYAEDLKHGRIGEYYSDSTENYARGMERYRGAYDSYFDQQSNMGGQTSSSTDNSVTNTVGDIHVNITQPGASAQDVQRAVRDGVQDALAQSYQQGISNSKGSFV